jgi:hypothetical protein
MTLVLEDGTGVVTANAYATVAEVDAILAVNIHSKWSLVTDNATKESLIQWASRILDERVRWNGRKTHHTSGLAWPRVCVRDREDTPIDDNVVPRAVKVAVAILADHLLSGDPELANTGSNITQLQVDVVFLKFDARLAPQRYPPELTAILKGLGWLSFGTGGPKRIIKH